MFQKTGLYIKTPNPMGPEEDLDREEGDYDSDYEPEEESVYTGDAFLTGFTMGMFITAGITFITYVVIPGEACP
jgi:hypothetical protein